MVARESAAYKRHQDIMPTCMLVIRVRQKAPGLTFLRGNRFHRHSCTYRAPTKTKEDPNVRLASSLVAHKPTVMPATAARGDESPGSERLVWQASRWSGSPGNQSAASRSTSEPVAPLSIITCLQNHYFASSLNASSISNPPAFTLAVDYRPSVFKNATV